MKTVLLFSTLFIGLNVFSQEILWAKKIPSPSYISSKDLVTDHDGNVYNYGNHLFGYYAGNQTIVNDTGGTYLQKFDPDGNIIYSKRWKFPFYIQKLLYDGNSAFYFTGAFAGNQSVNGNIIISKGDADGMVGKIDIDGNVSWVKTFGGTHADYGNSLCFNLTKNKLIVAGGLSDSLFVDHNYKGSATKPMFLATFDLYGNLENYKLYDFDLTRTNSNTGQEILCDQQGNYLLLGDRDGVFWSDYPVTGPREGRYVFKLNTSLDTLWSQFIINSGCYYGWSCKGLSIASNGDALIPSYCSSKYGGQGQIFRLDHASGNIIWTYANKDGRYPDTHTAGSFFYTVGTEGADIYPGQGNHGGYQVIKKFGNNNQLLGEARINDVMLTDVIVHSSGKMFVKGYFSNRTAVIGNTTLVADSSSSYQYYYTYRSDFLIGLNSFDFSSNSAQPFTESIEPGPEMTSKTSVYPNPGEGLINIEIINPTDQHVQISATNILGQTIVNKTYLLTGEKFNAIIDLSKEAKGVYFIEISSGKQKEIKRIVVN